MFLQRLHGQSVWPDKRLSVLLDVVFPDYCPTGGEQFNHSMLATTTTTQNIGVNGINGLKPSNCSFDLEEYLLNTTISPHLRSLETSPLLQPRINLGLMRMTSKMHPVIKLASGFEIPRLGFGVRSAPDLNHAHMTNMDTKRSTKRIEPSNTSSNAISYTNLQ